MCAGWTPFESVPQLPSTYVYLRNDSTGRHVGAEPDGTIKMHEHCGDDCMWLLEDHQVSEAVAQLTITPRPTDKHAPRRHRRASAGERLTSP